MRWDRNLRNRRGSVRAAAFGSTLLWLSLTLLPATAGDWPQFLGPERNGSYHGTRLGRSWPAEGPRVLWQRPIGRGFSGPVIHHQQLILFHRIADQAVVTCLDERTGRESWKAQYPTDYRDDFGFDDGPRASPAIGDGRVFTFGAEGRLSCWNLADGALLWKIDTQKEFESGKGFFGRASSPLIERDVVIVHVGGRRGGVVAFDAATGKVRWKATEDEAGYASPVLGNIAGQRVVLSLTREALMGLLPLDGRVLFRYPWRPPMQASVSAATPLVIGDFVFLSACYGAGATLLQVKDQEPTVVWSNDESLSNHYANSVHHAGFLYGWHGRQEQGCDLRCVELKTGKVRWTESGLKAGSVTLAGDDLLVLTENGRLLLAPADPAAFKPIANVQALPYGVRAFPALDDGLLFARSKDRLFCLDLIQER